jgi:small subunit ribosomal protein S20
MPHHKQYEKSLRRDAKARTVNRSQRARLRGAVREFRAETNAKKAAALLPKVTALLDKSAKTHLIHPSTANRLKSRLALALRRLQGSRAAA